MATGNQSLKVVQPSVCRHFLSKGMFVTGQLDPSADPVEPTGDGHCWCNLSAGVLGPDNDLVERETCTAARSCFEPRG